MSMMKKLKTVNYQVEGPDWKHTVSLDPDAFDTEQARIFEAGTKAIEKQIEVADVFNVGAVVIVRKGRKEVLVNAYICLNNAAQYKIAEELRANFKKQTGQDLSVDESGYSY